MTTRMTLWWSRMIITVSMPSSCGGLELGTVGHGQWQQWRHRQHDEDERERKKREQPEEAEEEVDEERVRLQWAVVQAEAAYAELGERMKDLQEEEERWRNEALKPT